jgi:transcriptional regulator with XRE-family HTH domain
MGATEFAESQFRENLRRERENRKWSQAHLAKLLSNKGFQVYPTTIAKIETGQRAARIDEVVAVADIFDVAVDALVGRSSRRRSGGDKTIRFSALGSLIRQMAGQAESLEAALRDRLGDIDGLDLRKDELAAFTECQRAADAVADSITAIRKAERRLSPVNNRFVTEFLFDDNKYGES